MLALQSDFHAVTEVFYHDLAENLPMTPRCNKTKIPSSYQGLRAWLLLASLTFLEANSGLSVDQNLFPTLLLLPPSSPSRAQSKHLLGEVLPNHPSETAPYLFPTELDALVCFIVLIAEASRGSSCLFGCILLLISPC